jgi:hypothetical protein
MQLAQKAGDAEGKMLLFDMARAWLALAEQAEKNSETTLVYETPEPRVQPAQQQHSQPAQQQQQPQPDQSNDPPDKT